MPAVRLHVAPGFETAVFPYTTTYPVAHAVGAPPLLSARGRFMSPTPTRSTSLSMNSTTAVDIYDGLRDSTWLRKVGRTLHFVFGRTAARTLCNPSLRTASGPEGSSAKQCLSCAAGPSGSR